MTKFILIRHGKPDYSLVNEKNFKGHGNDLGFLSEEGINQAILASKNELLDNASVLISSPYTRCMHTASIISNKVNLPIKGEVNIHEWLPDLTYSYHERQIIFDNYSKAIEDYLNNINDNTSYEALINVKKRVLEVFDKYLNYDKVIVVTHAGVIYSLLKERVNYCAVIEIVYDGKTLKKI